MDSFEGDILPGLTDDAAIQCIARVPRSAFGILRCVNRSWRNLLSSSFIFTIRKDLGLTEEWLYVMLRSNTGQHQWKVFQVSQRTWQILPPMPEFAIGATCSVMDSKLYFIGGSHAGIPTRKVWIYDPRFNKWTTASPMRAPREFAAAGVIGGKIYVVGGCSPGSLSGSIAWAEMYDPSVGKWNVFSSPPERRERWMQGSAVVDEKLFAVADSGGLVMDPCSNTWSTVCENLGGWRGKAAVVKRMLFSCNHMDKIIAYHFENDRWRSLELAEKALPQLEWGFKMAGVSGKLFVLGKHSPKAGVSLLNLSAVEIEEGSDQKLQGRVLWSHSSQVDLCGAAIIHCLPIGL